MKVHWKHFSQNQTLKVKVLFAAFYHALWAHRQGDSTARDLDSGPGESGKMERKAKSANMLHDLRELDTFLSGWEVRIVWRHLLF